MSTDTALWKAIGNMPDALKTELLHYAEYLLEKYPNIPKTNEETEESHGYGSWAGKIIMSDDFDEPLADLEEYYPESNSEVTEEENPKKRRSGILKGTFVLPLPDDFDEPLEDFREYM